MAKKTPFFPLPSGELTQQWKITIFHGKIHYKWPFSIAMLVHQRVNPQNVGWVILGPSLGWKYDQAVQPAVVALSGTLWKVPFWNVPSETILDNMYLYIYISCT